MFHLNEQKVIIYEPSKESRIVSVNVNPETMLDIDNVIFNEDGSICDDFDTFSENLSADETIGFSPGSLSVQTRKFLETLPPITLKKQKKIERIKKAKATLQDKKLKNKLQKIRKKKSKLSSEKISPMSDDRVALSSSVAVRSQKNRSNFKGSKFNNASKNFPPPRRKIFFHQLAHSAASLNDSETNFSETTTSNRLKNSWRKPDSNQIQPTSRKSQNLGNILTDSSSIHIPWRNKVTPWKNKSSKINREPIGNNMDFIPIGNHKQSPVTFKNNGPIQLTNQSRYFNLAIDSQSEFKNMSPSHKRFRESELI